MNRRAGSLSDVMVYANVCPRFSVATGKIRYLGSQPPKGEERPDIGARTLASMDEVWCMPFSSFVLLLSFLLFLVFLSLWRVGSARCNHP